MAIEKRLIGVKNLYVGAVLETGIMPSISEMTEMGEILPDSVAVTKEDDTITDLKNQETGQVDISLLSEVGAESLAFAVRNFKSDNLTLAFGGGVENGIWKEPASAFRGREKSALVIGRNVNGLHQIVSFPRTKMTAKMQAELVETESATILYTMKKLIPQIESSGVDMQPKYIYSQPASSDTGIVDNANNTFEFSPVENFDVVEDYEWSDDGGVTFVDVTAFIIDVSVSLPIAVGDLLVRVKENLTGSNQYVAGFALANDEEFTV